MPKVELSLPNPKYWLIFCAGVGITGGLVALGLWFGHVSHTPQSLLPEKIARSANFTPYFYRGKIPQGYSFNPNDTVYSQGIFSAKLTKSGSSDIAITEQILPDKLRQTDILSSGDKMSLEIGQGSLNSIEGRYLGTIIATRKNESVLILVNSTESTDKNKISEFMRGLRSVR